MMAMQYTFIDIPSFILAQPAHKRIIKGVWHIHHFSCSLTYSQNVTIFFLGYMEYLGVKIISESKSSEYTAGHPLKKPKRRDNSEQLDNGNFTGSRE